MVIAPTLELVPGSGQAAVPIAAPPQESAASTVAFTIEIDPHESPSIAPIEGGPSLRSGTQPPAAKSAPPFVDVSVTFESDEHPTPAWPDRVDARSEFAPSANTTTVLVAITNGAEAFDSTPERRIVRSELRMAISSVTVVPVMINELTSVLLEDPLHLVKRSLLTSTGPRRRSHLLSAML
jgi:hypothetical protein